MVRKNIHKNLMKQVSRKFPKLANAELEEVEEIVEREALRKKESLNQKLKRKIAVANNYI
jgi:hypothetical protein